MDKANSYRGIAGWVGIALLLIIVFLFVRGCTKAEEKRNPFRVSATAGMASATATGPAYVGGPQSNPLTVTVGITSVNGIIPPYETIPTSNLNVAVISTPSAILKYLTLVNGTPYPGKTIGEVDVDKYNSGLSVSSNGTLTNNKNQPTSYNNLVLVPGFHTITMYGPFSISSALTISGFIAFGVTVSSSGSATIPAQAVYNLPSNSEQWDGSTITGTYAAFSNMAAQLTILLPPPTGSTTPGKIQQTQTIPSNGLLTFSGFDNGNANPVTAAGITSLEIDIPPQPTRPPAKKQ